MFELSDDPYICSPPSTLVAVIVVIPARSAITSPEGSEMLGVPQMG